MPQSDSEDWIEVPSLNPIPEVMSDKVNEIPDSHQLYNAMEVNAQTYLENHPDDSIFHAKLATTRKERYMLQETFINHLPEHRQQEFRCRTCRGFIRGWGRLVCIDSMTGDLIPLFWNPSSSVPMVFKDSVRAIADLFKQSSVLDQLQHDSAPNGGMVGVVESGGFKHMHYDFTHYWEKKGGKKYSSGLKPASIPELVVMLDRVLLDNDKRTVEHASYLLLEDKLPYSDKHKGAMRWLQQLYEPDRFSGRDERSRQNLLFYFAAESFVGCINSLRNGMPGELLKIVRQGKNFEEIARRWSDLAGPTSYMRPTAAPKAGNIAAAEKLFAEMKLTEHDMTRAFLTLDQIPSSAFLYQSLPPAFTAASIFSTVIPRVKSTGRNEGDIPAASISFAKFVSEVLPTAQKIEYKLPEKAGIFFFITGLPHTAPLMQWHTPTNLASWYVGSRSREVKEHKLVSGWVQVPYIVSFPHMWTDLPSSEPSTTEKEELDSSTLPSSEAMASFKHKQHGISYLVGLSGAVDEDAGGLCLFPTLLKSEMHGVRATIEAYSEKGKIEQLGKGRDGFVGGIQIQKEKGHEMDEMLRITNRKGRVETWKIILFD